MGIRTYPDTRRIYLDMDGVLADFEGAAAAHGMRPQDFKRVAGAYRELPPYAGALDAVLQLSKLDVLLFALTKIPQSNPYAATEKLLWIREHFPVIGENVIITPDKGAVGRPCDVLVDDMPGWANANNFPGTVIRFEGCWQRAFQRILDTVSN